MRKFLIPLLALLVLLSGCADDTADRQIYIMDTVCNTTVRGENREEVLGEIENMLEGVDKMCSPTKKDSEINSLNRKGSEGMEVSTELSDILKKANRINSETKGAFDVTLGEVIDLWDIGGKNNIPNDAELSKAISMCGADKLQINGTSARVDDGCTVNLGGIAKGYAAGKAMQIFRENNLPGALLSIGGNICVWGEKDKDARWKIGVRNPEGTASDYIGVIELRDTVIAVSGDYERYFEKDGVRYHHIFDAESGKPAESDIRSVSVICEDGTRADALSTALFVLGRENALNLWRERSDFECIIIGKDKKVTVTEGVSDIFNLTDGGYSLEVAYR